MKIEDCKTGMRVKCIRDNRSGIVVNTEKLLHEGDWIDVKADGERIIRHYRPRDVKQDI